MVKNNNIENRLVDPEKFVPLNNLLDKIAADVKNKKRTRSYSPEVLAEIANDHKFDAVKSLATMSGALSNSALQFLVQLSWIQIHGMNETTGVIKTEPGQVLAYAHREVRSFNFGPVPKTDGASILDSFNVSDTYQTQLTLLNEPPGTSLYVVKEGEFHAQRPSGFERFKIKYSNSKLSLSSDRHLAQPGIHLLNFSGPISTNPNMTVNSVRMTDEDRNLNQIYLEKDGNTQYTWRAGSIEQGGEKRIVHDLVLEERPNEWSTAIAKIDRDIYGKIRSRTFVTVLPPKIADNYREFTFIKDSSSTRLKTTTLMIPDFPAQLDLGIPGERANVLGYYNNLLQQALTPKEQII